MKIKYTRELNLDLNQVADALMNAMIDQLNEELGEIVETDMDVEYLEKYKPNIKNELFPIISKKLMQWRTN